MNDKPKMKVSLDGGQTYQDAPEGVRIVYDNIPVVIDGEDSLGELHINHTTETVVTDLWGTRADSLDTHIATSVATVDDITPEMD